MPLRTGRQYPSHIYSTTDVVSKAFTHGSAKNGWYILHLADHQPSFLRPTPQTPSNPAMKIRTNVLLTLNSARYQQSTCDSKQPHLAHLSHPNFTTYPRDPHPRWRARTTHRYPSRILLLSQTNSDTRLVGIERSTHRSSDRPRQRIGSTA